MIYVIFGIFLLVSMLLIINFKIEHKNILIRKNNNILEIRTNIYVSLIFLIIGFLFGAFFIICYFFNLLKEFNFQNLILSLLLPLFSYFVSLFLINNKVYMMNNKIIKKFLFFKKEWKIKDITLIKHYSNIFMFNFVIYYAKNKRAFVVSYKHQVIPCQFDQKIKELSNCKIDLKN